MLGVVAIHIGAQYLSNPAPNMGLVALFEVVSRFSVPIFFFLSAFGLFYKIDLAAPFDYGKFLRRRFKAVLLPYLIWSALYIIHDGFFYETGLPSLSSLLVILFFGLAKYQLYFLVLLIWFYLLMPLWIKIIRHLTPTIFAIIFFLQIAFNYFSSYSEDLFLYSISLPEDSILRLFLIWRLNYLVLHYVFIFLLGGILAVHSQKFFDRMASHKLIITAIFFMTLIIYVEWFLLMPEMKNYTPLDAVNTAHQLSPLGFLYTIAATIFLFMIFQCVHLGKILQKIFGVLGKNSYFIYLFHPFVITYLAAEFSRLGQTMTATNAMIFYFLTVFISLAVSLLWKGVLHLKKFFTGLILVAAIIGGNAEAVQVEGRGSTEHSAIHNAMRAAIEQELGAHVDSKTLVQNHQVISDEIALSSDGFISGYKIISKRVENGIHVVTIDATVNSEEINTRLMSKLQKKILVNTNADSPRVAVIAYDNFGNEYPEIENEILAALERQGFTRTFDLDRLDAAVKQRIANENSPALVKMLANDFHIDYLVLSRLNVNKNNARAANLSSRLISVNTGEIIYSGNSNSNVGMFTANAENVAIKQVATRAGYEISQAALNSAAQIEKHITLLITPNTLEKMGGTVTAASNRVKNFSGVNDVYVRQMNSGLELDLDFDGTASDLVIELERAGFKILEMKSDFVKI